MKFGVLRFPGSCDEVDALLACRRFGEAELLWHHDRDLKGVDAVVVPGGFSYGDYLRAGAIARFSPVMDAVADFARSGGLVFGICNGFQGVSNVHVGRLVELDVDDPSQLPRMCEQLLSNPLIEDYEIVQ